MVTKPKAKPKAATAKNETDVAIIERTVGSAIVEFDQNQINLVKRTIAKDATTDELMMFIGLCKQSQLNPFKKEIYFIKDQSGKVMTQVAIDGLRLIAERSGDYAGQDEPEFEYESDGKTLKLAKVAIYRWRGNIRYKAAVGVAHWIEFVRNTPTWKSKGHVMLSKVAEAIALRKAYPNDTAKLYIAEEVMSSGMTPKLEIDNAIEAELADEPENAIEAETAYEPEITIEPIDDGMDQQNEEMPPMPDDFLMPDAETEPEKAPTPIENAFTPNGKILEARATWLQLMKNLKVEDKESKIKMAKTLMANYRKAVIEKLTLSEIDDFIAKTKNAIANPGMPMPKAVTPEVMAPKPVTDEKVLSCGTCEMVAGEKSDPKNYEAIDRTGWCQKCCDNIK